MKIDVRIKTKSLRRIVAGLVLVWMAGFSTFATVAESSGSKKKPNILFALADDWSWPHASIAADMGVMGSDQVIKTPTFDKIARQGVLLKNSFCSAPSCGPS